MGLNTNNDNKLYCNYKYLLLITLSNFQSSYLFIFDHVLIIYSIALTWNVMTSICFFHFTLIVIIRLITRARQKS